MFFAFLLAALGPGNSGELAVLDAQEINLLLFCNVEG
jgi:hypothetical protein